jgi:hypothetical protein
MTLFYFDTFTHTLRVSGIYHPSSGATLQIGAVGITTCNIIYSVLVAENNSINFLDLLISRRHNSFDINIYKKQTTTNTTINYFLNHPMEHRLAAYLPAYMINRMSSIPLSQEKLNTEWQTILEIASSNNFPEPIITKLRTTLQNPNKTYDGNSKQKKWATFTYHSPKIRKVTNTKIAFKSCNTTAQKTRTKNCHPTHDLKKKCHITTLLQNLPQGLCWTDWKKSQNKVPGTHEIYKEQRPTIRICHTHLREQT